MKHFLFIILAIFLAVSAEAADVGMSISVGQPGFYGQIDIGNYPQPRLIYPKPVVIISAPVGVAPPQPVYLNVPPGHQKKWKKHCHKYNACNRPVYFVRDDWYNNVYVPGYQKRHGHKGGGHGDYYSGRGKGHGKGRGKGHNRN